MNGGEQLRNTKKANEAYVNRRTGFGSVGDSKSMPSQFLHKSVTLTSILDNPCDFHLLKYN